MSQADLDAVAEQLGRTPRGILEVVSRCPSGHPNVVKTEPRLDDGTPFPTMFYLTCDRLAGEIGTLEASGLMKEMSDRLTEDEALAAHYRAAHEAYLAEREAIGHVPEIDRDHGRRHADPGQVPARPGRSLAGQGPRRQPAR